ncbi:MAG TPA: hypothetical protein DEQ34_04165 [Balneolaceae bacterium]|nr:hypothetical protein [Balneolaceae bacterium]|tara:strand:- start:281522 stop:282040 length:519 start_codon:yes stop_codon:yes gene_type:complete
MKKQLLLFLFAITLSVPAFSQVKIGYMNPNEVLSQLEEVATVEQAINSLIEQRDQDLIAKSTQLQQDLAAYEEGKALLNEEARATKEQELLKRDQELQEERDTYLNEVRQKRSMMLQPIIMRMDSVMTDIAEEMNLDLILNQGTSYGDAIIFYAQDERLNITPIVIARLKEN